MYNVLMPIHKDETRTQRQVSAVGDLPVRAGSVTVTLLYVFEELEADLGGTISLKEYGEVPEVVTHARGRLEGRGLTVEALVAEGRPDDVIVSLATEQNMDHIVVGGRSRSPTGKALFGSVIQSVILNSEVPVTVVPESDEGGK